ncbi:pterin-4-alpha-carbinolamine dehydratase [Rufibacter radiotolerans]|uniref:Putative pterin-4-alpha-carbinolamine dehydratase n=1 Tax=Rufibacter radiotolerans TaxID=1379910 RepID=A0A0H4VKV4_9BACT|nr:4a-hydroxytetrahydrobiopterin dehydratase [Rufibacter radiotolerans]AKQ46430.1 pterin-4-alpha-carbinolamine dehydratase [Rufibacter radiotolerans]
MMSLTEKKCVPCEGGVPTIQGQEIENYTCQLKSKWTVVEEKLLRREFTFPDFVTALAFVNKVGAIAEEEGHHPDLHLSYGKVVVELWTHAIQGLSENDFIVAAKIDALGF